MYSITHPPWRLHHQPPMSLLTNRVGCTVKLSTTHTLSVAPLITHSLNPVSCWLHQQSRISLLTHPGSRTVSHYLFTPYRVSRTVNHPCLYSPTLSAALSVTHLSSPLLCRLHRQACIPLLTHPGGCTISHSSLYSPTMSAKLSSTQTHPVSCTINHPSP